MLFARHGTVGACHASPRRLKAWPEKLQRIIEAWQREGFIDETIEPGSVVHTDGWLGYDRLKAQECRHRTTFLSDHAEPAVELMPRVRLVVSRSSDGCWGPTKAP